MSDNYIGSLVAGKFLIKHLTETVGEKIKFWLVFIFGLSEFYAAGHVSI